MFLSVIVPVYNGEKYLRECILSVLQQPYSDIEVICVNDGSTDSSVLVLEELAEKDPRMRVFTQPNQGVASARNKGIAQAKGAYLAFLDQDDCYCKNVLTEAVIKSILEKPYDLISFGYYESNQQMQRGRLRPREAGERENLANFAGEHYRHHSAYFYRTEFVRENGILVDPYRNEDERFRMQCIYMAALAKYVSAPLFVYRNNQLSVTHQKKKASMVLQSCLEGFSLLSRQTKHSLVEAYCLDTMLHLLLELAIKMAKEGETPETITHDLEMRGVQELYGRGSWMSDSDKQMWTLYFDNTDAFAAKHKRKALGQNCARQLLRIAFVRDMYEKRKYPKNLSEYVCQL